MTKAAKVIENSQCDLKIALLNELAILSMTSRVPRLL